MNITKCMLYPQRAAGFSDATFSGNGQKSISGHSMGGLGALVLALRNQMNMSASRRFRPLSPHRKYRGTASLCRISW